MSRPAEPHASSPLALADLLGAWSIVRLVAYRRGGGAGRFRGRAVVTATAPGVARYEESGRLEIGGRSFAASRRYWIREEGTATLALYFADGESGFDAATARPFVRLAPSPDGALAGTHRCGEDRYDGAYRARGSRSIGIVWRVTGPRKEGVVRSRLVREPPPRK